MENSKIKRVRKYGDARMTLCAAATVGRFRMSIFYFILRLFVVDDCAESAIVNALLFISDALWALVLGKIFGWW